MSVLIYRASVVLAELGRAAGRGRAIMAFRQSLNVAPVKRARSSLVVVAASLMSLRVFGQHALQPGHARAHVSTSIEAECRSIDLNQPHCVSFRPIKQAGGRQASCGL